MSRIVSKEAELMKFKHKQETKLARANFLMRPKHAAFIVVWTLWIFDFPFVGKDQFLQTIGLTHISTHKRVFPSKVTDMAWKFFPSAQDITNHFTHLRPWKFRCKLGFNYFAIDVDRKRLIIADININSIRDKFELLEYLVSKNVDVRCWNAAWWYISDGAVSSTSF